MEQLHEPHHLAAAWQIVSTINDNPRDNELHRHIQIRATTNHTTFTGVGVGIAARVTIPTLHPSEGTWAATINDPNKRAHAIIRYAAGAARNKRQDNPQTIGLSASRLTDEPTLPGMDAPWHVTVSYDGETIRTVGTAERPQLENIHPELDEWAPGDYPTTGFAYGPKVWRQLADIAKAVGAEDDPLTCRLGSGPWAAFATCAPPEGDMRDVTVEGLVLSETEHQAAA